MCSQREFDFTDKDFRVVQRLIYDQAGISLSNAKQNLVYSRLSRRLRANKLSSFADYLAFLDTNSCERELFVNALTTNLTSFFREEYHFPILAQHLQGLGTSKPLDLWSCAASTGEEPYSIAMTVADLFDTLTPPVRILATDIDTQALEKARQGVYPIDRVAQLTGRQLKRYFLKGQGENENLVKVRPELQACVVFRPLNLLSPHWRVGGPFAAIFCRNVLIYFDKPTQKRLLERFVPLLGTDGLLFGGHSENFVLVSNSFKPHGRTVYQLKNNGTRIPGGGTNDEVIR